MHIRPLRINNESRLLTKGSFDLGLNFNPRVRDMVGRGAKEENHALYVSSGLIFSPC